MLSAKLRKLWITLLLCIFFSACGYRFTGSGSFRGGITSLSIEVFENRTSETGVETTFTNDLIYEVTRDQKVALTRKETADAVLTGVIASIWTENISYQEAYASLERRVHVSVDLRLTDLDGKKIWSVKGVTDNEAYAVAQIRQATEQNRDDAISILSKRLAENLYHRLTEDF
jgi:2-keto-3-deoxy-galactonokinase